MKNRTRLILLLLLALPAAVSMAPKAEAQTTQYPNWTCSVDAVAASLVLCQPRNPDASLSMFITGIEAQSTTSTAGQFLLQYGTGTACGTGTTSIFPSSAAVVRVPYPANTSAPTFITFPNALRVPKGNDLCVLAVATNTFSGQIVGYSSPN